jgi:FkbM family methyltransferase
MNIRSANDWALSSLVFIRDFLSTKSSNRYILGINSWSDSIIEKIPIEAFVDDYTDQTTHKDVPVIRSSDLSANGLVVNASTVRTWDAHLRLNQLGVKHLDYYSFQRYSDLDLLQIRDVPWDLWVLESKINSDSYDDLSALLHDAKSRNTLKSLLDFRQDCQIARLSEFRFLPNEQYFDFFSDLQGEIFHDVGGYDGMTSQLFAKACPSYKSIKIFEPDIFNVHSIKKNLEHLGNLDVVNVALCDKKGLVGFSSGRGSASTLDTSSHNLVEADIGDTYANPPPTFIKMDIEGGEESALAGFSKTIKDSRPRMAIAAYHRPTDLWKLTSLAKIFNPSYRVALRHYTQGQMESILYFF